MSQSGWPVAADYDEAIQNPHINLDDPELKAGEPEYDRYGSPAVRSGNFASVYMLRTTDRSVAVRCFLRDVADQQDRYAAISRDLLGLKLPYTVNFTYLQKGIRVQGNWYPILKMDWCPGDLLDTYLEKNLNDPHKLSRLADKWYEMSVVLRKQGIAHGDLQHGNVMVLDDELQLIDYDGMFVPRLAGRNSNERGLEHYQHPGRTDAHFGRYLDNFSNWVIYTTLLSLAEDSSLWSLVSLQDKHLLFNKNDFERPNQSNTFKYLKNHDNHTIRTYATTVENLLLYPVEQIPDLNPDRPILYPPQRPASSPGFRADTGGDSGRDKGNLLASGVKRPVDRGYLHEERPAAGDKGGLMDAKEGGLKEQILGAVPPKVLISVAALLVIWVTAAVGYLIYTKSQTTAGGGGSGTKVAGSEDDKTALVLAIHDAKEGQYGEAKTRLQKLIDNSNTAAALKSRALCSLALMQIEQSSARLDKGKLNGAIGMFDQAISLDKDNAAAYYGRGKTNEILDKDAEAQRDLQKAKDLGWGGK